MAGLEDRVGALEERMDHHAATLGDIRSMVGDVRGEMRELRSELRGEMNQLRGDMNQFAGQLRGEMSQLGGQLRGEMGQFRGELHGFRDDMSRRFEQIDQRFMWLVGIQTGTLVAIIGGLVGVLYR